MDISSNDSNNFSPYNIFEFHYLYIHNVKMTKRCESYIYNICTHTIASAAHVIVKFICTSIS